MPGNGEVRPSASTLSQEDRDRILALGARATDAERAAREADAARLEAYREFQRRSFEAGCARSLHREAAAKAARARDIARQARREWRETIIGICRRWGRENPGADIKAWHEFLSGLSELCGIAPRDLLRLSGRRFPRRTPAELEEDYRAFIEGRESIRSIARRRGLRVRAVQKAILKRDTDRKLSELSALDDMIDSILPGSGKEA